MTTSLPVPFREPVLEVAPSHECSLFAIFQTFSCRHFTLQAQTADYQAFADQLADAVATAIQPLFRARLDVEDKGGRLFDPVTLADKAAERVMRELIQDRYPAHGMLGEEEGSIVGSYELTWVLDPIDGNRAFIICCILDKCLQRLFFQDLDREVPEALIGDHQFVIGLLDVRCRVAVAINHPFARGVQYLPQVPANGCTQMKCPCPIRAIA